MPSTPDPKTALLVDSIIRRLDMCSVRQNALLAATEFGMGVPTTDRALDLAFGCVPLQAFDRSASGPDRDPISLSKGVARLGLILDPEEVTVHEPALYAITQSTPVTLAGLDSALGSKPVQDVYVFGVVLLVAAVSTSLVGDEVYANKTASLSTHWLRGGVNGAGSVLMVRRDYSLDEALDCLRSGSALVYTGDITEPHLVLLHFVLSIDRYDPDDAAKNRVQATAILDERVARGWGGFCEEQMASILVPALALSEAAAVKQSAALSTSLEALVVKWVGLSWAPDFKSYWEDESPFPLPDRLKLYVNEVLGLGIV